MPSSWDHCSPCPFRTVTPTENPDTNSVEERTVEIEIAALSGGNGSMENPAMKLSAERLEAAADCGKCIFNYHCKLFSYSASYNIDTGRMRIFFLRRSQA